MPRERFVGAWREARRVANVVGDAQKASALLREKIASFGERCSGSPEFSPQASHSFFQRQDRRAMRDRIAFLP